MSYLDNRSPESGPPSSQIARPYFPLPTALSAGLVSLEELEPHNAQVAGMMIRNGRMPDQAGTIEQPNGSIAAYDVVDGMLGTRSLVITPVDKSAVDQTTRRVLAGGLIVLTDIERGIVKPVAEIDRVSRAEWNSSFIRFGEVAIRSLVMGASVYEIDDLCTDTGEVQARIPKIYF